MTILDQAYELSKDSIKFEFDDKLYAIRRNLMIISSFAIGLTFVIPAAKNGSYEVNVGVIKGIIEKPEYVSYFLGITCLYYLCWFWIHCRKLVVNNYPIIKHQFMSHLASLRAKEAYIETANSIESKLPTAPIFTSEGGGRGTWTSIVNFEAKVETEYKDGLTELIKDKSFSYQKVNDKIKLSYQYNTILEDYQYLNAFLDHYLKWTPKMGQQVKVY